MKKQYILPAIALILILLLSGLAAYRAFSNPDIEVRTADQQENAIEGYRININTATVEELDMLPGVGPALALRIIEHRLVYGPYQSIYELLEVEGLGETTLDRFKDYITAR